MPELDTITVKGFKSIAEIDQLKLGAINVIVGPNGSGTSNFIGVFSFLNAIREGRLQEYVKRAGGAEKVLHFGSKITKNLHIRISFREGQNQYEIELQPTDASFNLIRRTVQRVTPVHWRRSSNDQSATSPASYALMSSSR
jgi:predicted ATPase